MTNELKREQVASWSKRKQLDFIIEWSGRSAQAVNAMSVLMDADTVVDWVMDVVEDFQGSLTI
ncbi:hypothetical protein [Lacticaseibacillus manihotivorans]|uniref:Uncharacterized protein n=2 Tax=Lacticaseibacillus manihotivorans TaxID=88233 RepID=A0A0R1QV50_9LACO|nr:hypothetical protein [Lacticaseibacillus manihotivorans]KRL45091.1 hypothetical protein FD01_GL000881 [Lacticaseibacillus manihotivorans DSM 13343 = JCM 12514]QFQ90980.1 hypothetical protein LM010_05880 [Lacticaseibacillus manihotivorans]